MRVAIFDFDGTLYKRETFQEMMDHLKNHPAFGSRYKSFILRMLPSYLGSKVKLYPLAKMRERAMQIYMQTFHDLPEKEIHKFLKEIAKKFSADFNERVVERLFEHKKKGDFLMLVSGAYLPLLREATKEYPFHTIIGTEIPFHKGKLKDPRDIYHIQGTRKTKAIQQELHNKSIDWVNSFAYADSYSDLPVFQLVGHPIAVDPDQKLQEHAQKNNWEII